MSNDPPNEDQSDRITDESTRSDRDRPPGRESGDKARERMAWALFALLTAYVLLHPFFPDYTPDPTVAGAIVTGLVSLLVTRALGNNGGGVV